MSLNCGSNLLKTIKHINTHWKHETFKRQLNKAVEIIVPDVFVIVLERVNHQMITCHAEIKLIRC